VYLDFGTPHQRKLADVTPDELAGHAFPAGSMGPKVQAATRFANNTGGRAAIGSLADIAAIVAGAAGTNIATRTGSRMAAAPAMGGG
jgi:carbamate kinase